MSKTKRVSGIKVARRLAGLTQDEFAEQVGVSIGAVSQWETGRTKPNARRLQRISLILGVPIEKLLTDVEYVPEIKRRKNRIKELRIIFDISQKELADRVNVSQPFLCDLERNRRGATPETMQRIADVFGIDVKYLMKQDKEVG